ncbi:MAG: hypothetical protein HPZ00_08165 [Christensenellaceae bacterium]|nr:hypothetical protein [Christensenellaceae bacterium]MBS6564975.1 hypothetical protein [Clostridiales bacterium]
MGEDAIAALRNLGYNKREIINIMFL